MIRPYILKMDTSEEEFEAAKADLEKYGNSAIDYFKTYRDKLIYTSDEFDGFIAYRIAGILRWYWSYLLACLKADRDLLSRLTVIAWKVE
ncbi:hypothetical protein [Pedobacter steynii]